MIVKQRKVDGSEKKLTEKVFETMESSTALKWIKGRLGKT